jgi:hypothetical protein
VMMKRAVERAAGAPAQGLRGHFARRAVRAPRLPWRAPSDRQAEGGAGDIGLRRSRTDEGRRGLTHVLFVNAARIVRPVGRERPRSSAPPPGGPGRRIYADERSLSLAPLDWDENRRHPPCRATDGARERILYACESRRCPPCGQVARTARLRLNGRSFCRCRPQICRHAGDVRAQHFPFLPVVHRTIVTAR